MCRLREINTSHSFQTSFSYTVSVYSHNHPRRQGGNDRIRRCMKVKKEPRTPHISGLGERVDGGVIYRERDTKLRERW